MKTISERMKQANDYVEEHPLPNEIVSMRVLFHTVMNMAHDLNASEEEWDALMNQFVTAEVDCEQEAYKRTIKRLAH